MLRVCKITATAICCCYIIFTSCKSPSQQKTKEIDQSDNVLNQFKHSFNDTLPTPKNYVSDYEEIFSPGQEDSLNSIIASFEKKTTNQIAIVSFDTAMVTRENFDILTLKLANTWEVGQKDKKNGILIGISLDYKKIRIQNGIGIQKILSDSTTEVIINNSFIPFFKQGDYFNGMLNGVNTIIQKLNQLQP